MRVGDGYWEGEVDSDFALVQITDKSLPRVEELMQSELDSLPDHVAREAATRIRYKQVGIPSREGKL